MATLIINGQELPRLSRRIVDRLSRGTLGYEALCGWTGSSHQSVACQLHRLKLKGLVEHDGRRPRTWALKGQLPAAPEVPLLGMDLDCKSHAQRGGYVQLPGYKPVKSGGSHKLKVPEAA